MFHNGFSELVSLPDDSMESETEKNDSDSEFGTFKEGSQWRLLETIKNCQGSNGQSYFIFK